jgi:hypothetical protein
MTSTSIGGSIAQSTRRISSNLSDGLYGLRVGGIIGAALGIVAVGAVGAWIISILGAVVLSFVFKALNIDK